MNRGHGMENRTTRAMSALTVIARGADAGFDDPGRAISMACFAQAVRDLVSAFEGSRDSRQDAYSSAAYLAQPRIRELENLGIDTDWAREKLRVAGVFGESK